VHGDHLRAGWDERHLNAPEFAAAMVEAGAQMITVHGRTRAQGFSGKSDRTIIKKVREALPREVPLVGNGDVVSVDDYFRMREETGCDAVMIGRGALGNPWLFRSIAARLAGQPDPGAPDLAERWRVFDRHLDHIAAYAPPRRLVHELRKAVAWYSKGLHRSAEVRERAWSEDDPQVVRTIAREYFAFLLQEISARGSGASPVDKSHRQVA
jgi:tRNA-dihydrouridine synthase